MRATASLRLGVGDRGMGHSLLVLTAPGRQRFANPMQGLADPGDVAVAEDRPNTVDEAIAILGHLNGKPAHHGLSRGKFDGRRHATASRAFARAGQRDQALLYLRKAFDEGFHDRKKLQGEQDFAMLRTTIEFKQLIAEQKLE